MKINQTIGIVSILAVILITGNCGGSEEANNSKLALLALAGGSDDPVEQAASSGIDASTESMETLTLESAEVAALLSPPQKRGGFFDLLFEMFSPSLEAMDSTISCLGGGSFTRTVTSGLDFYDSGGPSSSFSVTKAFHSCRFFPFGRTYNDGNTQVYWNNLSGSSPYIQSGTQLRIAPNRSLTNTRRFTKTFTSVGNGSAIPSPGDQKIGLSVDWSSAGSSGSSYTLNIDKTREVKDSLGQSLIRHTITTPGSFTVTTDVSAGTRTANGIVQVVHEISGFTVTLTHTNTVWNYTNCLPVSGNISLSVTGTKNATGSITLGPGSLSYEYSGPRSSGSGTIDPTGCQ